MEMAKKGRPRQMLATHTEAMAFHRSPRKLMFDWIRPQLLRTHEMGLSTLSNSISQARLLIAVGTMKGKSKPARMNRLKWNVWFSTNAKPSPRNSLKGTVTKL